MQQLPRVGALLAFGLAALLATGSLGLAPLGQAEAAGEAGAVAGGGKAGAATALGAASEVAPGPGIAAGSRELPALRTRTSRTFKRPDGRYARELYPGSIHYRDGEAAWRPIENELVPASAGGYAHRNKANRYALELPADLAGAPVRVSEGGAWLTFALADARASARIAGATARFPDALPGVEVSYRASNDVVKETLTLSGPAAPTSFLWTLRTSAGLSASKNSVGAIEFRDGTGALRFAFLPPVMETPPERSRPKPPSRSRGRAIITYWR